MSRTLTPDSTLESLKKDAKRWLKAIRTGDAAAVARLVAASPAAPREPGLRDVQTALAREYGFPGWVALRAALDDLALARRSHRERVDIVLRACTFGGDRVAAARVLSRWPEISSDSLYTAVVTGNLDLVERMLSADAGAAGRKGGVLDREPLLYLAYARLPSGEAAAVEMARLLLDAGADAGVRWHDDWGNPFTVLTGVIGQGEGVQPTLPRAEELARLLIERGASPYDPQALYNTSITSDDTTWLELLWAESEKAGVLSQWRAVPDSPAGGKVRLCQLDYLLGNAVAFGHLARAEWLLAHGADANSLHAYSARPQREEALVYGNTAMAELLERFGAVAHALTGKAAFSAACMRLDRETARRLAAAHPEYLSDAETMLVAARGRADVVALLLELGMDVDVTDAQLFRGIHNAVAADSMAVVRVLVAHGTDIDRPTKQYGGALGFAAHFQRRDIADVLAPMSRDVFNLTRLGMRARLTELFAENPSLVNMRHPRAGNTPLFWLPDDDADAHDMATFLLAKGADPAIRDRDGATPEQALRKLGLIDAADALAVYSEPAASGDDTR